MAELVAIVVMVQGLVCLTRRRVGDFVPLYSCSFVNRVRQSQRGQLVVEYILLLMVSVIIALLIVRTMVGSDPENPGAVIRAWTGMTRGVANDPADTPAQQ
jgi:hypothetical protein